MEPAVDTFDAVTRLTKDIRNAGKALSAQEARYLVDSYYQIQEWRMTAANQARALSASGEPNEVVEWLFAQAETLEGQIKRALAAYSQASPVGRWAESQIGIGPVLSAGLLAHIDVSKCPTVGHIYSFAGIAASGKKWEKGQKRPWNAALKVLCWKIGESFVKTSGNKNDVYGHLWAERKANEWEWNLAGKNAPAALEGASRVGKSTEAWKWYAGCYTVEAARAYLDDKALVAAEPGSGVAMLPPGHVHARAKRFAVKIFLSHWFEVAYRELHGKEAPAPYAIAILGHAHKIEANKRE